MSGVPSPAAPVAAYQEAVLTAAERNAGVSVVEVGLPPELASASFATRFPARYVRLPGPDPVPAAVERSATGGPVFVGAPVPLLLGTSYPEIVRSLVLPRLNVKLFGFPSVGPSADGGGLHGIRDDLGTMRSLPAMAVVAPADAPTVRSATAALAERPGPAYVRLPPWDAPAVTDGSFALGKARELRSGSDLAIVALGPLVAPALEVADELARVGLSVRVLDAASVKPFDEAAVLRAARDTGAILVAEAGPLGTGVGTLVAAMTAENTPVPVRRIGYPDLWPPGETSAQLDGLGVSVGRLRDEAWELLRLRERVP